MQKSICAVKLNIQADLQLDIYVLCTGITKEYA